MSNTVKTDFIATGVDKYVSSLAAGEDAFTKLSESAKSPGLSADFTRAASEISTALGGVKDNVGDLGKSTDSLKPTFGGEYLKESQKVNAGFEISKVAAESFADTVTKASKSVSGLPDAGKNSLLEIEKFAKETVAELAPLQNIKVNLAVPDKQFDDLSKKATETRNSLQDIAKTRLDGGQVNNLTREIVRAGERSRDLQTRISDIKREINSPTRKSSIAFLTEELKGAEREAESLSRKLNTLSPSSAGSGGKLPGGKRRGLTEFQRTALEIADDFAPAGFNRPFNAISKELIAVNTLSTGTLATFGAIAVAGVAIVKVSQNIRAEAENYLKVQTSITGAINRQILAQKQGLLDLKNAREEASTNRTFSRILDTSSVQELKNQRAELEKQLNIIPTTLPVLENGKVVQKANDLFQKLAQQLTNIDTQIETTQQKTQKAGADAFSANNERFKKLQVDDLQFEAKRLERERQRLEKRAADIKAATEKSQELTKEYRETFDNLFVSTSKDNPFASIFSESDRAVNKLRENLKGLSPELRSIAEQLQKKVDGDKLFSARLDNDFAAFDFRQRANELRDFKTPKIDDTQNFFKEFIENAIKQAVAANGGSSIRFNRLGSGGFSQSSIENEFTTNFNRVSNKDGSFGGFVQSPKTFADLTEKEKFDFTNKDNIGAQKRLSATLDLAGNRNALNDTQKSEIDRKILSLSANLRPEQLNDQQRDRVATAAENEAKRRENIETVAAKARQDQIEIQTKIANYQEQLLKIAETGGTAALIKIVDETNGGAKAELQKSANASDTANAYYDPNSSFNTSGGLTNR